MKIQQFKKIIGVCVLFKSNLGERWCKSSRTIFPEYIHIDNLTINDKFRLYKYLSKTHSKIKYTFSLNLDYRRITVIPLHVD